ncbi:MAG: RimK family alpha-L-glutamate ligase [Candidatus Methanofastidiosia archaeon]
MRIGILSSKKKGLPSHYSGTQLYNEILKRGFEPVVADVSDILCGVGEGFSYSFAGKKIDFCLYQMLSEGSHARMILRHLENCGVRTLNSSKAIANSSNKYLTYLNAKRAGIKILKTFLLNTKDPLEGISKKLGFPFVLKPVSGEGGFGLYKVESLEEASSILSEETFPILCQEYLQKKENKDLRIYVIGGEVVCGIYRYGKDWISNISHGSEIKPMREIPEEVKEFALRALKCNGLEMAGIDLFEGEEYILGETNSVPGFRGVFEATGIKLEEKIIDYVVEVMR